LNRIGPRGGFVALFFCLVSGRLDAQGLASEWTYQYVLSTSDRGGDLVHIIASYPNQPWLRETPMRDLLAETLVRGAQSLDYSQPNLVTMAKILCRASPRYRSALAAVSASASRLQGFRRDDREYRAQLAKLSTKCVDELDATGVPQYRPGAIDLDGMRRQFLGPHTETRPTTAQGQKLITIHVGEDGATFDDVIGLLGTPRHVTVGTPILATGGFRAGGVRWSTHTYVKYRQTNRIHYCYRGIGRVTFVYRNSGWRANEAIADPMLCEREMPYRADAPANGQPDEMTLRMHELLYGGYRSARQALDTWAPVSFTPEVKDTAAEILSSRYAPDRGRIIDDTFLVIARFLAESDASRYGSLVKEMAARASDRRLRKLADSIVIDNPDPSRRYQPGAVSLEALRAKYPPLYPESTLIGPEGNGQDPDEDGDQ